MEYFNFNSKKAKPITASDLEEKKDEEVRARTPEIEIEK